MNPFVHAVTAAGPDGCWEAELYYASKFDPRRRETYMETRRSALGPEWSELQRCVIHHGRNVRMARERWLYEEIVERLIVVDKA